jgi:hypothetical protein
MILSWILNIIILLRKMKLSEFLNSKKMNLLLLDYKELKEHVLNYII